MESKNVVVAPDVPWNKGKFAGQKPPQKLRELWSIRIATSDGIESS